MDEGRRRLHLGGGVASIHRLAAVVTWTVWRASTATTGPSPPTEAP